MKKTLLLLSVLLVFLLSACKVTVSPGLFADFSSPSPSEESPEVTAPPAVSTEPDTGLLGEVQGDTYVNSALGFSAAIPEGWQVANQQDIDALYGFSSDYLKEATGLEANSQAYIFYCSRYRIGNEALNPNVNISVSNQTEMLSAIESEDAFYAFVDAYRPIISDLYGGSEVKLEGDISVTINGKDYSVIHISGDLNGTPIWQDQYFTGAGGYALIITETYYDEQDGIKTDALINSLQFN